MNPVIKVIGVGGSGGNTVSRIAKFNTGGIELIAVNTDAQALHFCKAPYKILIGKNSTKGLGAGMDMSLGKKAAEENIKEVSEFLKGADMVFITCGLGGGTGSGATAPIAEVEKTTVSNAFLLCDDMLRQAVESITDLVLAPGIITIDFASVTSIMKNSGQALFGTGRATGQNRAEEAAKKAINSPLLDFSIKDSKGVLFNISGNDVTLHEIQSASKIITEHIDKKAKIVFGAVKDSSLKKGEIKITVIATKF